ncbi:MAG: PEP-CTERM system histidine kinase PrsK [Rubrivivax sp.]|nr:PEP-CTERM system histidine kinase PrsK [Rubrivivax sp.]
MDLGAADLFSLAYGVGALAHAAFALVVWRAGRSQRISPAMALALMAGTATSAGWALVSLLDAHSTLRITAYSAALLDVLRYGAWYAFLLLLLDARLTTDWRTIARSRLALVAVALIALALGEVWVRVAAGAHRVDAWTPGLGIALMLGVYGALLCEQLFRNLDEDSRWGAKPVCLALLVVFAFDVFMNAEALLFGRLDPDAVAVRPLVHTLALPLLMVAMRRRGDWLRSVQVSRSAAFHSATLVLAGGYLLFMAAIGYYVRYFGGSWGRGLQLGLLFAGALALLVVMVSGSLRSRLRVFVGKHFFSYRFDYREEWLRFTAMLSGTSSPQEVSNLVIRGLANMVESPGGDLWMRTGNEDGFRQATRWNVAGVAESESPQGSLVTFLQEQGWVIDLDEFRSSPRRYKNLALPLWLLGSANTWLVVPLVVGERLLGFVTLARPRAPMELNWEVRDLLKTASRQAASYLAQMEAAEALIEARKFEAFNRMSAFVVHDLKNIVTQLSLMLKNAERLHDNPEFQKDMRLTVESSLEKMRRLLLQLREGTPPAGGVHGVELEPIIRRIARTVAAQGRELEIDIGDKLSTRGHDERLERVLGHLVQNALDATPPDGRVWMKMSRRSGQVIVEVGDTGAGMSEEFVRTRLFRPFSTTKGSGMGIGSFESAQYVRELGGSIDVDSRPGAGTTMIVVLPLFETGSARLESSITTLN